MHFVRQPDEIIDHRYRLLGELGQGGSGVTYEAELLSTGQRVALKELSLKGLKDWKQVELFEREARTLKGLSHPAIPQYVDYFQVDTPDNRWFYLAQELAEGTSLADWVASGWRGDEADIRAIAQAVLQVLDYLHSLNPPVIHRDIKPQNILRRDDGHIYLVDFGAVQTVYRHTMSLGSTVVGTYGYMAPEQFRGQAVPATDLYGLGATLLFLLTHQSPADLPQRRLRLDFRPYVSVSPALADWLDQVARSPWWKTALPQPSRRCQHSFSPPQ
jgi:serine/threonine protein kinase